MQADALRPLKSSLDDVDADDSSEKPELRKSPYSEEELQEAIQFLKLGVRLLRFISAYVRSLTEFWMIMTLSMMNGIPYP